MNTKTSVVSQDPEFKRFIRERTKTIRPSTANLYETRLKKYVNYNKMSLSDLIEEAEDEQENGVKSRKRKVNKRIVDFVDYMEEEGFSPYTIRGFVELIKSFYTNCDVDTRRIGTPSPTNNAIFDNLIEKEEIKLAVQNATVRDKAIILTHMSSGMALNEVRNLKYGDFLNAIQEYTKRKDFIPVNELIGLLKDEDAIGTWKLVRSKTDQRFLTFTSPEANRTILDYLNYRQNKSYRINSNEDVLFSSTLRDGALSNNAYCKIFKRLNDNLGFGRFPNGRGRFSSHQLRKYFESNSLYSGVDKMLIDWMTAHNTKHIDASYFKVKEEKMRLQYIKVLPELTLDEVQHVTIEDPEVKKMKEHNLEMAKIIQQYKEFSNLPTPSESIN